MFGFSFFCFSFFFRFNYFKLGPVGGSRGNSESDQWGTSPSRSHQPVLKVRTTESYRMCVCGSSPYNREQLHPEMVDFNVSYFKTKIFILLGDRHFTNTLKAFYECSLSLKGADWAPVVTNRSLWGMTVKVDFNFLYIINIYLYLTTCLNTKAEYNTSPGYCFEQCEAFHEMRSLRNFVLFLWLKFSISSMESFRNDDCNLGLSRVYGGPPAQSWMLSILYRMLRDPFLSHL